MSFSSVTHLLLIGLGKLLLPNKQLILVEIECDIKLEKVIDVWVSVYATANFGNEGPVFTLHFVFWLML